MSDPDTFDWPFFDDDHRGLAETLATWADGRIPGLVGAPGTPMDDHQLDATCRAVVAALGKDGWLRHTVPASHGGARDRVDVRSLCIAREVLGWHSGLADFCFAMQGLGSGPISLFGTPQQRERYLPDIAGGRRIAAFALSETKAGSDVSALAMSATRDGDSYVLDGEKTWISNGGIADHYVVFARTGEAAGAKGLSAFMVDADTPGLEIAERIHASAPHPLATLRFNNCRVPAEAMIGEPGNGFKIAMATLDVFRPTVGAAALGFARRALCDATDRAADRQMFGQQLGQLQMIQAMLADMATEVDAAALLVYRAAWLKDSGRERISREASMAKLYATEAAQRVIDRAVQIHGGQGVTIGVKVEELYREVRALRIYEGATEVQKIIIARSQLDRPTSPRLR